ncbi:MAG: cyclic nucleotide-binding domain-containing protein [Actinomycetota bacterium]|nr:cyclic nucleotide-binding domain-containing protein [Actinomycetota bacterium]
MPQTEEIVDTLAQLTLFGDLSKPQLEEVAHTFEEESFGEGQRILRQGFTGGGFYVILEGEASVRIDGQEINKISRGDFFGEISIILGEPPSADVVALGPLRCLVLAGPDVRDFLISHPTAMFRMLQTEARRLRNSNLWRS